MIGQGELKEQIIENIKSKNLDDKVIILGIRKDVNKIYSALDCYLFPSFYEGMPNTVIEAQCNGLPCIVSDRIDSKVKISNKLFFEDIEKPDKWLEKINIIRRDNINHSYSQKELKESNYDITKVVKTFENIFFNSSI